MNILEDEAPSLNELQKCKISYLEVENAWMSKEVDFVNDLILKYKKLIALSGEPEKEEEINALKQEIKAEI